MPEPENRKSRMPLPALLTLIAHILIAIGLSIAVGNAWAEVNSAAYYEQAMSINPDMLHSALVSVMIALILTAAYWIATFIWGCFLLARSRAFPAVYTLLVALECWLPALFFFSGLTDIAEQKNAIDTLAVLFSGVLLILFIGSIVYFFFSKKTRAFLKEKKAS